VTDRNLVLIAAARRQPILRVRRPHRVAMDGGNAGALSCHTADGRLNKHQIHGLKVSATAVN